MFKTSSFFLSLTLLFSQCQQQQQTNYETIATETQHDGPLFGQEFPLIKHDQVTLFGGQAPRKLHLSLSQLNDSRCPVNVNCIQYGNATVVLSASNSQGKNELIELCIGQCAGNPIRDTHTVTALVGETNYKFTLKAVVPFPGEEKSGETKQVRLVVEKL